MRAQQEDRVVAGQATGVYVEGVLHVSRGVAGRHAESFEVVEVILDLGTLLGTGDHLIADFLKDFAGQVHHQVDRMAGSWRLVEHWHAANLLHKDMMIDRIDIAGFASPTAYLHGVA